MRSRQRGDVRGTLAVCLLRASVTVEAELEWFFNLAECEMGVGSNFLPLLECGGEPVDWTTPEDRLEAAHAWRLIRGWLRTMPDSDAGVLQAAYETRLWPRTLRDELGTLTGIVVRLACATDPWPQDRESQQLIEMARAGWLAGECRDRGKYGPVSRLRGEAKVRLARALHVYRCVRGRHPGLPRAV
jgi:hypothetical protein